MTENETLVGRESIDGDRFWKKEPPTDPGFYWCRYVDAKGNARDIDIIWLIEPGKAYEFGWEHNFEPMVGCFEYGPKIEAPDKALEE